MSLKNTQTLQNATLTPTLTPTPTPTPSPSSNSSSSTSSDNNKKFTEGVIIFVSTLFLGFVTLGTLFYLVDRTVTVKDELGLVSATTKSYYAIVKEVVIESFALDSPFALFLQFLMNFGSIGLLFIFESKGYVKAPGPNTTPNSADVEQGVGDIVFGVLLFLLCILFIWYFLIRGTYAGIGRQVASIGISTIILILTLILTGYIFYLGSYYIRVGKGYN